MIEAYLQHEKERAKQGIPALPLTPEQTADLAKLLVKPPKGKEQFLLDLIKDRVSPGVDPAAKVKAEFLGEIVTGKKKSPLIDPVAAIRMLGTMIGGYNVAPLVAALKDKKLADEAACALSGMYLVYDAFDEIAKLATVGKNAAAMKVLKSWADADWFTHRKGVPDTIKVKVYKVEGEINTDDFSPAGDAWSRPDIPLHSLAMGKTRFKDGLATIAKFRKEGFQVAFVGDVVGTGSSRKSACNSVLWAIGDEIPCVPNKKTAGVIIGGVIAPIFFNTAQDSGALPLKADVTGMKTGDVIVIDTKKGDITDEAGKKVLSKLQPSAPTPCRRVPRRRPHPADHRPRRDRQGPQGPRPQADQCLHPAGQSQAQGQTGLLPGPEDGRQGLRRDRHPARHRLRAEDDHRRFPGHHRPDDRRRAEGTGLPQVPGPHVHAVLLPHRRLSETGRRQDAQDPARLHRRARRRCPASRRRRDPFLAQPPAAARHRRHRR